MNDQDIYNGVFGSGVGLSLAPRSNVNGATFSGNGVKTTFTFPEDAPIISNNPNSYDIIIHGVGQVPVDDYSISVETNSITFVDAPPAGTRNIYVRIITQAVSETDSTAVTINGYLTANPQAVPVPRLAGIGGPFNDQAQALLDNFALTSGNVQVASYEGLRAYTGPASAVQVTGYLVTSKPSGISGLFVLDSGDTTSVDNGGTIIVDTTGRRWKRADVDSYKVKWFELTGTDRVVDSNILQRIFTLLSSTGGTIEFEEGTYNLSVNKLGVFSPNAPNLRIIGKGMYLTHLQFSSEAGDAFKFDVGNRVFLEDLHISGYSGSGNYFTAGSIGINTAAEIVATNVWFDGFASLLNWRGGFYHRFYGCRFNKAQYCFKGFNANNFQLHAPRIAEVDYVGDFNSGSGPVVVLGGSIEKWTSTAFSTSGGARPHIAIIGTYIENYPSAAAGNGLAKSFYQGAFLTSGFGSITLMSGMGSLNGIRRLVANGGIDTRSIVSVGNEWQYQKGAGSDTDYFFVYQNLENGFFRDSLRNNITGQTGGYTPAYRAGSMLKPEAVTGYDPIADTVIYNEPGWTAATLLNGWANSDAANYESASFKKIGNRVFLRGYITGASATGNTILALPAGYYDDKYNLLATATLSGTPTAIALRVLNNGNLTIQNTSYTTVGAFSLDGLSFFVD